MNSHIGDGDVEEISHTKPIPQSSQPVNNDVSQPTEKNDKYEDAVIVEDVIADAEIKKGNAYISKAKSIEELTSRLAYIKTKYPTFPETEYNKLVANITSKS
jgi:hypothetical protein